MEIKCTDMRRYGTLSYLPREHGFNYMYWYHPPPRFESQIHYSEKPSDLRDEEGILILTLANADIHLKQREQTLFYLLESCNSIRITDHS